MVRKTPQPCYLMIEAALVDAALQETGHAVVPVSIANGEIKRDPAGWRVPRATLLQRVTIAMKQSRLKLLAGVNGADDMLLAVALAMWARAESSVAKNLFVTDRRRRLVDAPDRYRTSSASRA